jgi:hypothetical protein
VRVCGSGAGAGGATAGATCRLPALLLMRSRGAGGRARSGKEAAAGPRPPPPVVYGRCGVAQRRPGTHAAGSGASSWREAGMSGGDGRCAGSVAAWKAGGTGWWYWCLSRTIRGGTGSSPRRLSSSAKAVHETPSAMGAARTMARGRRAKHKHTLVGLLPTLISVRQPNGVGAATTGQTQAHTRTRSYYGTRTMALQICTRIALGASRARTTAT